MLFISMLQVKVDPAIHTQSYVEFNRNIDITMSERVSGQMC